MILLNSEKRMITLRHEPKLSLISCQLLVNERQLKLEAPGMESWTLFIDLQDKEKATSKQVYDIKLVFHFAKLMYSFDKTNLFQHLVY